MNDANDEYEKKLKRTVGDLQRVRSLKSQISGNNGLIAYYQKVMDDVVKKGVQEYPTQIQSCQNLILSLQSENSRLDAEIEQIVKYIGT